MPAQLTFSYPRESGSKRGPHFVAERADGVVIAWIKEHHESPLANLWSYRHGEFEAIFFGDVDIAIVSVGADGFPPNDDDIRVTYLLPSLRLSVRAVRSRHRNSSMPFGAT